MEQSVNKMLKNRYEKVAGVLEVSVRKIMQ